MRIFSSLDSFADSAGTDLGVSDWLTVDQKRIDTFADATGDHQWIHVDPARAAAGPFGSTIAHGLLTLSLFPVLMMEMFEVRGPRMGMNYGLNKIRYPAPVPVDSKIRLQLSIGEITRLEGAVQATLPGSIEIAGGPKPACVFEAIVRYIA